MATVREGAPGHGQPAHLLPQTYKRMIASWLEEDTPSFDYGGFVVGEHMAQARLLGKSPGIVAGVPFFNEVFKQLDCTVEWHIAEGANFAPVTHCATVRGPIRKILLGERVALNTLARCSGIATKTNSTLRLLRAAGYHNTLAGTRKTTPGFRLVEKYGMLVGGADPHRHDLSAMVMLKDNHIWACSGASSVVASGAVQAVIKQETAAANQRSAAAVSAAASATANGTAPHGQQHEEQTLSLQGEPGPASSTPTLANTSRPAISNAAAIAAAVHAAQASAGFALKVEVECQTQDEAEAAIRAGADVVMLDNFSPAELKRAAAALKDKFRGKEKFLIEVSGGLTEENVAEFVCDEVDVVSTSSIHQGVKHVDFSLKVIPEG